MKVNWYEMGVLAVCILIWAILMCFLVLAVGGCGGLSPELTELFKMSNAAAQDSNALCQHDPNTCAQSLSEAAEEFQMWMDIFRVEPNDQYR